MRGLAIAGLWLYLLTSAVRAGEIAAVGSGDGLDVLKSIAVAFSKANPGIQVVLPPSSGSSGGIASVVNETAILGRVARPLTDREKAQGLQAVSVVRFPAIFYVHPSVGIRNITAAQSIAIFSGAVTNWKEIGGPDMRIRVIRREEGESTLSTLRTHVAGWKDLLLTERSKLETNTAALLDTVLETSGGIGFGSYAPAAIKRGLIPLSLDGVAPLAPDYPAFQTLLIIYKQDKLTPDASVFLEYLRSAQAADIINASGAGIPAR